MKLQRLAVIVFILGSLHGLHGVEWSEPECICDTISSQPPVITIANDGIAWVVESPEIPQVFRFLDEQTGWQKVTECTLGTYSFSGNACFDKDDRLWVLTDDMVNALYNCYHAGIWSGVDTVPTNSGVGFAGITADSGGGVWVGWSTTMWGSIWWDVAYNRYKDGSWDAPNVLTDTLENTDHVIQSMTTDAYGRVWIVWMNYGDVDKVPYESLVSAYHDGDDWSEEILVCVVKEKFGDKGAHGALNLGPDSEGGVWVLRAWYYEVSSILVSYWNGEYWSSVDTIAEAGNLFEATPRCKLAVDSYGNAWAVWRQALEYNDKYGDIYYSVNSGSGWSEPAPVNEHSAADRYPDIAVDGAGRIWCVWQSERDSTAAWGYSIWASYTTSAGVEEIVVPIISPIEISTNLNRLSYDVSGCVTGKAQLILYSADGRRILEETIAGKGTWEAPIGFPSGVYFARVEGESAAYTGKVVLVR